MKFSFTEFSDCIESSSKKYHQVLLFDLPVKLVNYSSLRDVYPVLNDYPIAFSYAIVALHLGSQISSLK
ncbi:unnamed protein product [Rhizophagus irregularis]|nr:unnamed protein product [Rhizophagus irregularis]